MFEQSNMLSFNKNFNKFFSLKFLYKKQKQFNLKIYRLKSLSTNVLDKHNDVPDELLYGRAGYLAGLLYVNTNISPAPIEADLIKKVLFF